MALSKLLKSHTINVLHLRVEFRGAKMLELFEIYVTPVEDREVRLSLEGTIFKSVCHHPVQWVREFVDYWLVEPLRNGTAVGLQSLSQQYAWSIRWRENWRI